MSRLGSMLPPPAPPRAPPRWSTPPPPAEEAARCCSPADCSQRAITASPESAIPSCCPEGAPPGACPAAAAPAPPPPARRCDLRWGANLAAGSDHAIAGGVAAAWNPSSPGPRSAGAGGLRNAAAGSREVDESPVGRLPPLALPSPFYFSALLLSFEKEEDQEDSAFRGLCDSVRNKMAQIVVFSV
ncbi:hypothetical protein GUJ93_ZPchr0010g10187 [Zizania palustris]|uniref:Uncharacterized protein n=1 Tax=Zizania palustris TaxID=103762 RepID=A0A8J5W8B6_ZIZPA|nr:hypothetical protein GUJ93_ZPchr0010g10187 [Zizania palustris]